MAITKSPHASQRKRSAKAEKKADRDTNEGAVFAYVHALQVELPPWLSCLCETVLLLAMMNSKHWAKTSPYGSLPPNPESLEDLLEQEYIRDAGATIGYLGPRTHWQNR